MRSVIMLICLLLTTLFASAQTDTAAGGRKSRIWLSGFGGVTAETSSIKSSISESLGAGGALTINNFFFLGGYAVGLTTNHYVDDLQDTLYRGKQLRLNFSHAGIWTGFIIMPRKRVHIGISSRFGWGHIYLAEKYNNSFIYNYNSGLDYTNDKIFVISPQVELEVNITSWLKFNMGVGYRIVTGIDFELYKSYNFNYPQITFGFYFGGFSQNDDDDDDAGSGSEDSGQE